VYRLRSLSPRLYLAAWLIWCVAVSGAYGVGWSRANGRFWFPALIGVVAGITVVAWLWWTPRWETLTLAPDGSSLTLRSARHREVVPLGAPVELRVYEQDVLDAQFGGDEPVNHRTELFITSGGRSVVVSGLRRAFELRRFAEKAAAVLGTGPPVVDKLVVSSASDGHRREDPTTRWVNGEFHINFGWRFMASVYGMVLAVVLTAGAVLTLVTPPDGPRVASAEEIDRQLTATMDALAADLDLAAEPTAGDVATAVAESPCERDHEWFWGPPGASGLEVEARAELRGIDTDRLIRELEAIARPRVGEGRFTYRPAPSLDEEPDPIGRVSTTVHRPAWLDIEVGTTSIAVTVATSCVDDGDVPTLAPSLHDHARVALARLVAQAGPRDA
jgi:hypothetical protein